MPHFKCYPISNPDTLWEYCPSYGAAIALSALFGGVTLAHIIQAILYRKPFAFVIIMGAIWETGGYVFRILSVEHQMSAGLYTAQQLLILLAPLWINAFAYMVLGRMVHFYLSRDRVFGIRARRITLMFVLCDIFAFLVQATGGMMITPSASIQTQRNGLHVYMGGIGVQLFFIVVFFTLAIQFHRLVKRENFHVHTLTDRPGEGVGKHTYRKSARQATKLVIVLYVALALIAYRNIYRLIEFSAGVQSSITTHEFYTYVFDSTPMLAAVALFSVFHPGRSLRGPNSDFSEENRKIKEAKKAKKAVKKQEKQMEKDAKKERKETKKNAKRERKEMKKMERLISKDGVYDKVDLST